MSADETPHDVTEIRREIDRVLNATDDDGRVVGNAQYGVYAFYDYDREPIYVGQTSERLRTRIRRHLTNQRTDAVAMNVLDPFEVAEIEMWPLFDLEGRRASDPDVKARLEAAEYTVFQKVLGESKFTAVLNEKEIPDAEEIDLPDSHRDRIIPDAIYDLRKHADIRIARRASTIAALARVISERRVSKGLRRTLLTQARRLEDLARRRLDEIGGDYPVEEPGEETGEVEATEGEE
ncbi:MAG: GIY-YIG nuclease family protein [Gaiellaceae bacterium]